jgi:hypothetical protein
MTTQINKPIATAENLFKDLVWSSAIKSAEAALFSEIPWLSIWPLGPIISFTITQYANKLFEGIRLAIDMEAIVLINDKNKSEFTDAALKLKIIAEESGTDSPEFIEARNDAAKKLSQFVHVIGT